VIFKIIISFTHEFFSQNKPNILFQKQFLQNDKYFRPKTSQSCKGLSESFSATKLDTHNLGLHLALQQIMVFLLAAGFSP
jgi:hypothetical protein